MTTFQQVYDAFFRYITDDMYLEMSPEQTLRDCESLLYASVPLFEFPLSPIELDEVNKCFNRKLSLEEINILGYGMVQAWLQRQITSIELIRQKFTGTDFKVSSQASHLDKLLTLFEKVKIEHRRMQMLKSRREIDTNDGSYKTTFYKLVTPLKS